MDDALMINKGAWIWTTFGRADHGNPEQHLLASIANADLREATLAFHRCANQILPSLWEIWVPGKSEADAIHVLQNTIRTFAGCDLGCFAPGATHVAGRVSTVLSNKARSRNRLPILFRAAREWFDRYPVLLEQMFETVALLDSNRRSFGLITHQLMTTVLEIIQQHLPDPRSSFAWKLLLYQTNLTSVRRNLTATSNQIQKMPNCYSCEPSFDRVILSREDLFIADDPELGVHQALIATFTVFQVRGIYLYLMDQITLDLTNNPAFLRRSDPNPRAIVDYHESTYQIYLPSGESLPCYFPRWIADAIEQFGSQGAKSARSIG